MVSLTHPRRILLKLPSLLTISWTATLLISALPTMLWQEFTGHVPEWLFWARLGLLVTLVLLGSLWSMIRALRPYFGIVFVLSLAEALLARVGGTTQWQHWFDNTAAPFVTTMVGVQLLRLGLTAIMIMALLMIYGR